MSPTHTLNWTCFLVPAGSLPIDDGPECQACRIQITREALASKVPDLSRVPLRLIPALGADEGPSFGSSI